MAMTTPLPALFLLQVYNLSLLRAFELFLHPIWSFFSSCHISSVFSLLTEPCSYHIANYDSPSSLSAPQYTLCALILQGSPLNVLYPQKLAANRHYCLKAAPVSFFDPNYLGARATAAVQGPHRLRCSPIPQTHLKFPQSTLFQWLDLFLCVRRLRCCEEGMCTLASIFFTQLTTASSFHAC